MTILFDLDKRELPSDPLKVWEEPQKNAVYVLGGDVAEGLEHGDASCAQILDARSGSQVACWHGRVPADVFGEQCEMLARWYNTALVGIESNNHGLTTITRLRQMEYPNLYRHKTVDQVTKKFTLKYGWPTTNVTKPLMIDELDRAMREGELTVYDKHTIGELKTYIRDERAKMHGSPHDDRVMALAVANQMMKYALSSHEIEAPRMVQWSAEWWASRTAQVTQAEAAKDKVEIGQFNRRR